MSTYSFSLVSSFFLFFFCSLSFSFSTMNRREKQSCVNLYRFSEESSKVFLLLLSLFSLRRKNATKSDWIFFSLTISYLFRTIVRAHSCKTQNFRAAVNNRSSCVSRSFPIENPSRVRARENIFNDNIQTAIGYH